MMITKQANGRFLWTHHKWDRELCTHVAQLAVDADNLIAELCENYQPHQARKLTRIREGLNKVIATIELENTTPRFSTKSIKAIDLIWAS
jgi:hypothetical protein